jgi:ribosomal protein L21E
MSRQIPNNDDDDFDLGDIVSFDHDGERLTGEVVRVYNTRTLYHVEVNDKRYEVEIPGDNPRKER